MSGHAPCPFDWEAAWLDHCDNLPHIRQDNVIYFVTFRLGDSLAVEETTILKHERDAWLRTNPRPHSIAQQRIYRRIWTAKIEALLDAGYGACVLGDPHCRCHLENSLRHFDGQQYRLGDFVIMPNHVHALVHVLSGFDLGKIIKAWKSVSARKIGKHLGRGGSYWIDEYFDHAVRNEASLSHFQKYIHENPKRLPPNSFTLGHGAEPLTVPPVPSPAEAQR